MKIAQKIFDDLVVLQPTVFEDTRGYFYESYNKNLFSSLGINADFVQDNQSLSQKDVLRGLHFQAPPFAQGKLVRAIKGSVLDIAVDIRKNSPYYGKHFSIVLSESNKTMMWIPEGFAHGFVTLEDNTIFSYKCTNTYNKASEGCILWNDPTLNINWQTKHPILSEKDQLGYSFNDFHSPF